MNIQVLINGVDVSIAVILGTLNIQCSVGKQPGSFNTCTFTLLHTYIDFGAISPLYYKEIRVVDTDIGNVLFRGYLTITHNIIKNGITTCYEVTANDSSKLLESTVIIPFREYTGQRSDIILTDLLTTYFPSFFDLSGIEEDLVSDPIDYISFFAETVMDAVKRLAQHSVADFWLDGDNKIHWAMTEANACPLQFGQGHEYQGTRDPAVTTRSGTVTEFTNDQSGCANRVYFAGGTVPSESVDNPVFAMSGFTCPISFAPITELVKYTLNYGKTAFFQVFDTTTGPMELASSTGNAAYLDVDGSTNINLAISNAGTYHIIYEQEQTGAPKTQFHVLQFFTPGFDYTITYNANQIAIAPVPRAPGDVDISITIVGGDATFLGSGRPFWIGDGYPIILDLKKGMGYYTSHAVYNSTLPSYGNPNYCSFWYDRLISSTAIYGPSYDAMGAGVGGGDYLISTNNRYLDIMIRDENVLSDAAAQYRAKTELMNRGKGILHGKLQTLWADGVLPGQWAYFDFPIFDDLASKTLLITSVGITFTGNIANYEITFGTYFPNLSDLFARQNNKNKRYESAPTGASPNQGTGVKPAIFAPPPVFTNATPVRYEGTTAFSIPNHAQMTTDLSNWVDITTTSEAAEFLGVDYGCKVFKRSGVRWATSGMTALISSLNFAQTSNTVIDSCGIEIRNSGTGFSSSNGSTHTPSGMLVVTHGSNDSQQTFRDNTGTTGGSGADTAWTPTTNYDVYVWWWARDGTTGYPSLDIGNITWMGWRIDASPYGASGVTTETDISSW